MQAGAGDFLERRRTLDDRQVRWTVGIVDFDDIMAGEAGLARRLELLSSRWDVSAEVCSVVAELAADRRLVTRSTVSFGGGDAHVTFHLGEVAVECHHVDSRTAAELAATAAGRGVDLRLVGLHPIEGGWALEVTAHLDGSPLPHRRHRLGGTSLTVEY